ncbi:MAG TPA: penicillin-binding protein 2 [Syntrophomonadaceae bacterium]|nr:penicillin-binding protein 2 [Syntrophomonadaceae bacterium]
MKPAEMKTRLRVYTIIVVVLLGLLSVRLAVVQLFKNQMYQTQAKDNRIRLVDMKAPRGEIFSRDNQLLATNKPVYTISLTYLNLQKGDLTTLSTNLSNLLKDNYPEMTSDLIQSKVQEQKFRLFEPIILIRDIPWDLVVKLEENRQQIPGVTITEEPLRSYPQGSLAGHVLGYVHSITQDELDKADGAQYSLNSLIGKSGLERQYEQQLRGTDGARRVEVDAKGRPIDELITLQPVAGNNLYLTIDTRLQRVMEQSMESTMKQVQGSYPKARVGAAVLINVKTGEILAMYSSPALNPEDLKGNVTTERAEYYFPQTGKYDPMKPGAATNRAIQVAYPPGSTFKPITGIAALETGVMNPLNYEVNCTGAYWLPPNIKCTGVHGPVNYYSAMAHSCNVYFQEMGRRAGKDEIVKVAGEFGLGAKTGIDLPYETQGLLPTPEWKKNINDLLMTRQRQSALKALEDKYNALLAQAGSEAEKQQLNQRKAQEKAKLDAQYKIDYDWTTNWQSYDTYNMSIGQGFNNYSVLQLADYVSTIANGGALWKPYVVSKVVSPQNKLISETKAQLTRRVSFQPENLAQTRRAMLQVTQVGGTAYSLFTNFPSTIQVGAKTGSAQTGRAGDDPLKEVHGVFIAFAPFDNPEIAFAGVVEYGFSGATSAGPVCKAVFEQYFGIVDHLAAAVNNTGATNSPQTTPAESGQNGAPVTGKTAPTGQTAAPTQPTQVPPSLQ